MLDIGWSEMLLIAVVAIVVIGPKDLPKVMRSVGNWVAKARATAREFQTGLDRMIADSELEELRKTANSIQNFDADKALNSVTDDEYKASESKATADDATPAAVDVADGYTPPLDDNDHQPENQTPEDGRKVSSPADGA
jgi:sec-independent protein translocase protein TatB